MRLSESENLQIGDVFYELPFDNTGTDPIINRYAVVALTPTHVALDTLEEEGRSAFGGMSRESMFANRLYDSPEEAVQQHRDECEAQVNQGGGNLDEARIRLARAQALLTHIRQLGQLPDRAEQLRALSRHLNKPTTLNPETPDAPQRDA